MKLVWVIAYQSSQYSAPPLQMLAFQGHGSSIYSHRGWGSFTIQNRALHYQIIGSAGNASSAELGFETTDLSPGPVDMDTGWGVDASNTINSKYFRLTTNSKSVAQRSLKLTSITGQSMTGKLIKHTGWGYRFAKGARGGSLLG